MVGGALAGARKAASRDRNETTSELFGLVRH